MEDGLVRTVNHSAMSALQSLNPCCDGRWSRTSAGCMLLGMSEDVLILVVMEDGLVPGRQRPAQCRGKNCLNPCCDGRWSRTHPSHSNECTSDSLNPCCSGRWSRTRPYKTILIINKLKNSTKQFFTFLNRKLTFP